MTQKYGDKKVYAPGTVIISTVGEVTDFRKIVIPVLKNDPATEIVYVDFSFDKLKLGGSSFAQILNKVGKEVPDVRDSEYFARAFTAIQQLVDEGIVLAGHDCADISLHTGRCVDWEKDRSGLGNCSIVFPWSICGGKQYIPHGSKIPEAGG